MLQKKSAIIIAVLSLVFLFQLQPFAEENLVFTEKEKAWLDKHHTVRARIGNVPPLHFFDGTYRGMSVQYLDLISKRVGFKVQYINDFSWPDALVHIKNHEEVDLLLTAKITPDRKKIMAFTKEYLIMPYVIFSRNDNFSISTIEDLTGKSVSIEKGYVLSGKILKEYPGIQLIEKSSTEKALHALSTGEVYAYIGNLAIATYIIQFKNLSNIKIAAPAPFDNHNQAMAIRSDWPELASIIDKTLNAMKTEEHKAIRSEWLSVRYEYGIQTIDIVKWVVLVVLIAALILTVILIWNRLLQREVAERKQAERALKEAHDELETKVEERTADYKRAKEEAERANKLKSEFLANMSHELRTPLHHILSYAHLTIKKYDTSKARTLGYIEQIAEAGNRMIALVDNLFDLSKLESRRMVYRFLENDIYGIVKDCTAGLQDQIEEKGISIVADEPTVPTKVICDRVTINQVIQNLLKNSIRFSPKNKRIVVLIEARQLFLSLSIKDEGPGVPADELDFIFEKFIQSSKTKTGSGGTGLGLAICKAIIDDHHGKIWAENNPDGGAKFSLLLPYERKIT